MISSCNLTNMNREIKFRAWDKVENKMWNENHIAVIGNTVLRYVTHYTGGEKDGQYTMLDETERLIPLQYTGLKDKNGTEIYERDILKVEEDDYYDERSGYVAFDEGTFCLANFKQRDNKWLQKIEIWDDGTHDWYSLENLFMGEVEVIGNIYENPELIEN